MSSRAPLLDLPVRPLALLLLAFSLSSCKEDPEMVRKSSEQKAEIAKLEGELKILEEKLNHLPVDRSAELTKLQQQVEDNKSTIAGLEQEVQTLSAQKTATEQKLTDYQRKYVVR